MTRRVAVLQMNSTSSIEHNLRQASDLITQARFSHARMACLPECFDYVVDDPTHAVSLTTGLHMSPLLQRYQALAAQTDMWLSLGGMQTLSTDGRLQTTHVLLPPHEMGPPRTYAQTHLPAGGSDGRHNGHTSAAGNSLAVAYETPLGNVGLSVGQDVYYAALFARLREAGAHVLLTPTCVRAGAQWMALARARAIENQAYVVGAAQVGVHTGMRESFGHSLVVGPQGDVLLDAGGEGIALACVDVDLQVVRDVREQCPLRKLRRDDLLGSVVSASAV